MDLPGEVEGLLGVLIRGDVGITGSGSCVEDLYTEDGDKLGRKDSSVDILRDIPFRSESIQLCTGGLYFVFDWRCLRTCQLEPLVVPMFSHLIVEKGYPTQPLEPVLWLDATKIEETRRIFVWKRVSLQRMSPDTKITTKVGCVTTGIIRAAHLVRRTVDQTRRRRLCVANTGNIDGSEGRTPTLVGPSF